MIIGVAPDEYEEILAAICGEGCEPDATITFADFEERLPAGPRAEIEARLTVDGVHFFDTKKESLLRRVVRVQAREQQSSRCAAPPRPRLVEGLAPTAATGM